MDVHIVYYWYSKRPSVYVNMYDRTNPCRKIGNATIRCRDKNKTREKEEKEAK